MASVRLLFVGCGSIAVHHLRAVGRSSVRAEVVGAVDPSKEAAEGFVRELTALQSCECRVGIVIDYRAPPCSIIHGIVPVQSVAPPTSHAHCRYSLASQRPWHGTTSLLWS